MGQCDFARSDLVVVAHIGRGARPPCSSSTSSPIRNCSTSKRDLLQSIPICSPISPARSAEKFAFSSIGQVSRIRDQPGARSSVDAISTPFTAAMATERHCGRSRVLRHGPGRAGLGRADMLARLPQPSDYDPLEHYSLARAATAPCVRPASRQSLPHPSTSKRYVPRTTRATVTASPNRAGRYPVVVVVPGSPELKVRHSAERTLTTVFATPSPRLRLPFG